MKKFIKYITNYQLMPLILVLLVMVSYCIFIPSMGFFMDDWYLIWFKHLFGALQYPSYFSIDRPLMGYFYVVANFLLGNSESPLVWQIFGLFTRWLCVYALWGFLNTLWPNAKRQNTLVVLLAAVYPGFTQQWVAMIYSFFFSCLACFFLSLTLMLKAIRTPKHFWIYFIFSLLTGVYSYAAAEFYFGLELIRPVVLWIEYSRVNPTFRFRLWKTLKTAAAFIIAYLVYAVWRAFFFVSANHGVEVTGSILKSPLSVIENLIQKIYQAGVDSVVNAWFNPLNLNNYPTKGTVPFLILGIIVFLFVLIFCWLQLTTKNNPEESDSHEKGWTREAFWLALISLVVAVLPFWAADLPIDYNFPFDRFLLAYLFGSCLLLVTLIDNKKKGLLIVAFLVAISAGYQINLGIRFKNTWVQQSDFFWQLAWRAPAIEKNTMLVAEDLPFSKYFSGPSLTAPMNMNYDPDLASNQIPYSIILTSQQGEVIKTYLPNLPISYNFRSFYFSGNTSALIFLQKPADGCLEIVSPADPVEKYAKKDDTEFWQSAIPLSNLDRVISNPANPVIPLEKYFGKENRNQWCYFFEKADLARQQKQWTQTIQIYLDAQKAGFKPLKDVEWLPLLDAYLNIKDINDAISMTKKVVNHDTTNIAGFCQLWSTAQKDQKIQPFAANELTWLNCSANRTP